MRISDPLPLGALWRDSEAFGAAALRSDAKNEIG
jgi:hypothetical protein